MTLLGVGDELGPRPPDDIDECDRTWDRFDETENPFFWSGA